MSNERICRTCKWWDRHKDAQDGTCTLITRDAAQPDDAPRPLAYVADGWTAFITLDTFCCVHWQARDAGDAVAAEGE